MKAIIRIIMLLMLTAPLATAMTPDGAPPADPQKADLLRENIEQSLAHKIDQVRINTIQLIIDIKTRFPGFDLDNTVIPLMRILKNEPREEFRILAAVALYHVRTETGRFAVSRRAIYDDSERVRRQCGRLSTRWGIELPDDPLLADGKW
jgi:hypothetical protein